jgi:hypothetical protein
MVPIDILGGASQMSNRPPLHQFALDKRKRFSPLSARKPSM